MTRQRQISLFVPPEEDAFDDLVTASERSAAAVGEAALELAGRHPEIAGELGDFAAELVLQDALPAEDAAARSDESLVAGALERFRERLAVPNPFAERPAAELVRLGGVLGLDKTLLVKLRDRKVEAATVPPELVEGLAGELTVPSAVVAAHLEAPPIVHSGLSFKARQKPQTGTKEGFAEAVRRSTLADEDKARWLAD